MDTKRQKTEELDAFYQLRINRDKREKLVSRYGNTLAAEVRRYLDVLLAGKK